MRVRYGPGWWHPEANPLRDIQEFMRDAEEEEYRQQFKGAGGRVDLGRVVMFRTESSSRPGVFYTQTVNGAGRWECDCKGFTYHGTDCRHIKFQKKRLYLPEDT